MRFKTFSPTPEDIDRKWWVVDAQGQTLGRLAARVALLLRGKHKPTFAPHMDMGDHVVIINAEKIHVTGDRRDTKIYYRHSGYPGALKSLTLRQALEKHPDRVLKLAIKGMLPKNALGRAQLGKLRVYAGPEHPHEAQNPEPFTDIKT